MIKNIKGFVMIETIIVITILSVGLISLYASYSLILSKAVSKSHHDNVSYIYKTYFVGKYLSENNLTNFSGSIKTIDLNESELFNIKNIYNIDKIYLAKGNYLTLTSASNLNLLDGSTISYLKSMKGYDESKINVIVKFKEYNEVTELYLTNFASIPL